MSLHSLIRGEGLARATCPAGILPDMANQPVVGDKYLFTWAELGKPTVQGSIKLPGLGTLIFDDADAHYANAVGDKAAFFIRKSGVLGKDIYVVVSRQQPA